MINMFGCIFTYHCHIVDTITVCMLTNILTDLYVHMLIPWFFWRSMCEHVNVWHCFVSTSI